MGFTQAEFGAAVGATRRAVQAWEAGERAIPDMLRPAMSAVARKLPEWRQLAVHLSGPTETVINNFVAHAIPALESADIAAAPRGAYGLSGHDFNDLQVAFYVAETGGDAIQPLYALWSDGSQRQLASRVHEVLKRVAADLGLSFGDQN